MKDSKQIYRMTYLLRLPNYKKNDFVKFEDDIYIIISLRSDKVKLLNLSNWEEEVVSPKKIENIKTLSGKEEIKEMMLVSQTEDEMQLMDTKTYETLQIKKPINITFNEEKIKVIRLEDKLFLKPRKNKK